jgi:hypothetical protein
MVKTPSTATLFRRVMRNVVSLFRIDPTTACGRLAERRQRSVAVLPEPTDHRQELDREDLGELPAYEPPEQDVSVDTNGEGFVPEPFLTATGSSDGD